MFRRFDRQPAFNLSLMTLIAIVAIFALVFFGQAAHAQDVLNTQPAPLKTVGEFIVSLVPAFLALVGTLFSAVLLPLLRNWLIELGKTKALARAVLKLETKAEAAVAYVNAGLKAEIELASADGVFTALERARLKDEGMRLFKEFLGKEGLDSIAGALGLGAAMVDTFLQGVLEKKVEAAKVASPS